MGIDCIRKSPSAHYAYGALKSSVGVARQEATRGDDFYGKGGWGGWVHYVILL